MKEQLCGVIDQQANTAAAEAARWLDDAATKVSWSKSFDDTIDREGVETRRSAVNDLCSALSDGDSLRADALRQVALAAAAAATDADRDSWLKQGDELQKKWDALDSQLKETRYGSSYGTNQLDYSFTTQFNSRQLFSYGSLANQLKC
jgi:hypothetical protein